MYQHMRANNPYKNQIIDYDAIMKSIKIDHLTQQKYTQTYEDKQQNRHFQSCQQFKQYNKSDMHQQLNNKKENERRILIREKLSNIYDQEERSKQNSNKVSTYSSIVFDDLSKQSCYESFCKDYTKMEEKTNNREKDKQQFRFYEEKVRNKSPIFTQNDDIHTPKQFKKVKNLRAGQYEESMAYRFHESDTDKQKQNNKYIHNTQEMFKTGQKQQHRYLSHTQTSQKKINKKSLILPRQTKSHTQIKSAFKYKKDQKKSGIQITNPKYLQRWNMI